MNWIKLYLSGGLCLVFALIVMFIVERFGGIAAEVADTIPSVVVPIVYMLLTQEDETRIEQANAVFASAIGTFATLTCFLPMWKILPKFFSESRLMKCWAFFFSWKIPILFTIIGSILAWILCVILLGYLQVVFSKFHIAVGFYSILIMGICAYFGVSRCVSVPPPEEEHNENCCMKIFRSITVIFMTIMGCIISALKPNLLGNLLPGFPNVFTSSIISVSFAQVALLPTGDLGPMILGGCSTGFFTMISAFTYGILYFHPIVSIIFAHLLVLFFWSRPIHDYIQWRREVTAEAVRQKKELKKQNRWWNRMRRSLKEKKENKERERNEQDGIGDGVVVNMDSKKEEGAEIGREDMERPFWSFFLLRCDKDFFLSDEKRAEKAKRKEKEKEKLEEEEKKKKKNDEEKVVVVGMNASQVHSNGQPSIFPPIPTFPPVNEGVVQNGGVNVSDVGNNPNTAEPAKKKWSFFKK